MEVLSQGWHNEFKWKRLCISKGKWRCWMVILSVMWILCCLQEAQGCKGNLMCSREVFHLYKRWFLCGLCKTAATGMAIQGNNGKSYYIIKNMTLFNSINSSNFTGWLTLNLLQKMFYFIRYEFLSAMF